MTLLYIGPGIGIGGLVVLLGVGVAILFMLYAFVVLPIRQFMRRDRNSGEDSDL